MRSETCIRDSLFFTDIARNTIDFVDYMINNPVSFAKSKYGSGVFGLGFTEAKRIIMAFLRGNKKTMHGGG